MRIGYELLDTEQGKALTRVSSAAELRLLPKILGPGPEIKIAIGHEGARPKGEFARPVVQYFFYYVTVGEMRVRCDDVPRLIEKEWRAEAIGLLCRTRSISPSEARRQLDAIPLGKLDPLFTKGPTGPSLRSVRCKAGGGELPAIYGELPKFPVENQRALLETSAHRGSDPRPLGGELPLRTAEERQQVQDRKALYERARARMRGEI